MTRHNRPPRTRRARRVVPAIAGAALASAIVAAGAGGASAADPACNYNGEYNTCLWITETSPGSDVYEVHIGVDVHMGQWQAQDILNRGGGFYARAMGDDTYDNFLFYVDRVYQTASPQGLSAEFHSTVSGARLDEDWGRDEVFGSVVLFNPGWGSRVFDTGVISDDF